MEKIKLVIWDLDETFWKGTISEGEIEVPTKNIEILKTLVDRGIMNSIVSKNNFDIVKNKLEELKIWNLFVFPKIEWSPKGKLVKTIISEMQLREINTLFIDDNHLNLKEVEFYNSSINIKNEKFISELLTHESLQGKNDLEHSRLKQYKLLEEKTQKSKLFINNNDFLRFSEIRITINDVGDSDLERVCELIERTNQLNFTKCRSTKEELQKLINNSNILTKKVIVHDKFGDYGIVGFVALDLEKKHLIHFTFSCRILNLGIEQYLYKKFDYPTIEIISEVSSDLYANLNIDWIQETNLENNLFLTKQIDDVKIFLKGGCDLEQLVHYLKKYKFSLEFNGVKDNIPLHKEHSFYILSALDNKDFYKIYEEELKNIPFIDESHYSTNLFDNDCDIVVYSLLMDFTQYVYESNKYGYKIAHGGYQNNLSKEKEFVINNYEYIDSSFIDFFNSNFTFKDVLSPDDFFQNIEKIIMNISKPIIFINGAERLPEISPERNSLERHKLINNTLDKIVDKYNNVFLLDMRKVVKNETLLTTDIRHYTREVYQIMAKELENLVEQIITTNES